MQAEFRKIFKKTSYYTIMRNFCKLLMRTVTGENRPYHKRVSIFKKCYQDQYVILKKEIKFLYLKITKISFSNILKTISTDEGSPNFCQKTFSKKLACQTFLQQNNIFQEQNLYFCHVVGENKFSPIMPWPKGGEDETKFPR